MSLRILAGIEAFFDDFVPISTFFDLIGGTGSGGLIALALGLKHQTASTFIPVLERHLQLSFSPSQSRIVGLYKTEGLYESIDGIFEGPREHKLMGRRVSY